MTKDLWGKPSAQQPDGLHYYSKGDRVQRQGGTCGTVISHTALTAEIRWPNGTVELVGQFDPRYTVAMRHADKEVT